MGELTYDQKAALFGKLMGEALAYINPKLEREQLSMFFILMHVFRGQELEDLRDFVCGEVEAYCREVLKAMEAVNGRE